MTMTSYLDAPEIDANQAEKAITANEALNALAASAAKMLTQAITTNTTLTYEAAEDGDKTGLQFMVLKLTGSAGSAYNVVVPTKEHFFAVLNTSTTTITVKTVSGTGIIVNPGATATLYCDGTNVVSINGGSGSSTGSIPQRISNAATTTTLGDADGHIYRAQADTTARTWTIAANSSVAYPIGTAITFVNDGASGNVTLAITSDTLVWSPTGGTGSRTLAPQGIATALKVTSTRWILSGSGLT
jgi:hypothetical protein